MSVLEPASRPPARASAEASNQPASVAIQRGETSLWQSLIALFKVRVVVLLLFASVGGLFLTAGGWPGIDRLIVLVITGGVTAAGASALNEYMEQGNDALMVRTRHRRPLVNGAITRPGWIPYLATAMILVPALAVLSFNVALAVFLLLGAAIYLGVYTAWLKPRTPLNIVIGGAAGSAAVLSGSAAAGMWHHPGAVLLALLVFMWTPTHFWSLAITYRDDYARTQTPMMPVQLAPRAAAAWVLLHTGGTALAAMSLSAQPSLGWGYAVPVGLASLYLLVCSVKLVATPSERRAHTLFLVSNVYLAAVLFMLCADVLA